MRNEGKLEEIVREILDDVDFYEIGQGPEGPWYYKSIEIRRIMNTIHIYDVDGMLWKYLTVPDFTKQEYTNDPHAALGAELEKANEKSLEAL